MRTTLTLDDDVAVAIELRRAARGTRLREEINDLLRAGLAAADRSEPESHDDELPVHDPGRRLISHLRDLDELLDDEDVARALPDRW